MEIQLNEQNSIAFETIDKKLRIIALKDGKELACRKTTPKILSAFLETDINTLFNGRLQLHKFGKELAISVRNTKIGSLPVHKLQDFLKDISYK